MQNLVEKIVELYRLRDFSFLALILSLILLPLSINLSSIALGTAIVLKILQILVKKKGFGVSKELMLSGLLGLAFLSYIFIKSIFLKEFKFTIASLEENSKYVLLLLIPFMLQKKAPNRLLIFGLFLGVIICVVFALCYSFFNGIPFNRYVFSTLFDIHHTYLSMFLLLTFNYILNINRHQFPMVATVLFSALIFYIIYSLNSKVSMVIFVIILAINLIWYSSKKNLVLYLLSIALVLLVFVKFINKDGVNYETALDYRTEIWQASIAQIKKNVVFGNLAQDEKQLLNYQHFLSGKHYFLDMDINSHNQYLSIILKLGLLGLFIFLLYAVLFLKSLKNTFPIAESREALGFALIIAITCFIENIFDRHHGIVFFTVFYNYYIVLLADE